jgi:hypothetical protein
LQYSVWAILKNQVEKWQNQKNNKINMDRKILGGIAVLFLFILSIGIIFYRKYRFLNDFKLTTGKVTEITLPGWKSSGDFSILYEYRINNKISLALRLS